MNACGALSARRRSQRPCYVSFIQARLIIAVVGSASSEACLEKASRITAQARSKTRETARGRRAPARRSAHSPETAPGIARSRSRLRAAPAPSRRIDARRCRRRDAGSACGRCRDVSGIGELRGIAVGGADAQRHRACPAGSVMPPSSTGSVVMRLPSWFELSNRRISSTAVLISSGLFDQPPLLRGIVRQRHQPVADQVGGGLVAGIEQEDAVVQQFLSRSAARHCPRPGSGGSARRVRDCRVWRAARSTRISR